MTATSFTCDGCGAQLTAQTNRGRLDYDWCYSCRRQEDIEDLKRQIADKEQWLALTHLAQIASWKKELAALEASPATEDPK